MWADWFDKVVVYGIVWVAFGSIVPFLWKEWQWRSVERARRSSRSLYKQDRWQRRIFDCYVYLWLAAGTWGFFDLILKNVITWPQG